MMCNACNKEVEGKRNMLLLILFFPWSLLFVKKKCPECGTKL